MLAGSCIYGIVWMFVVREREGDRQTDRQRQRETDRDRQSEADTHTQTDRHRDRGAERERERGSEGERLPERVGVRGKSWMRYTHPRILL